MIVNCKDIEYCIVELNPEDMEKILAGHDVWKESYANSDKNILVRVYCSVPQDVKRKK